MPFTTNQCIIKWSNYCCLQCWFCSLSDSNMEGWELQAEQEEDNKLQEWMPFRLTSEARWLEWLLRWWIASTSSPEWEIRSQPLPDQTKRSTEEAQQQALANSASNGGDGVGFHTSWWLHGGPLATTSYGFGCPAERRAEWSLTTFIWRRFTKEIQTQGLLCLRLLPECPNMNEVDSIVESELFPSKVSPFVSLVQKTTVRLWLKILSSLLRVGGNMHSPTPFWLPQC